MTDILTITLNPAYDVSSSVDTVVAGPKLRCDEPRFDPGGGGVNVSRAILRLGGQSEAFVALGGHIGTAFKTMLDAEGITVAHFAIAGNTRQSFAIVETSSKRQYRFQLPGPAWSPEQTGWMLDQLNPLLTKGRIVVLSGSVPTGVPADIAATINRMAVDNGARIILDTSGEALTRAAANRDLPYAMLRMDGAEASEVSGLEFASPTALADYGQQLINDGAANRLVMSMGARGTVAVSADDRFFCQPPKLEPLSAVGAGDSMVAAIALELAGGGSLRDAVRHGVAAAGSAVLTPATELCSKASADEILQQVVTNDI
ncbi:1-phosphofructokinase family hexose kinase [Hoeflea sp. YIM 152468]|uniref:1-phosphofructokinase family hexose kinase n=1 Tax=Hoeflea sp. YIM 152468 TaxID=3031759 RepID=UPI0023DA9FB6|nr:1-phosphofructokinase family hexose kinase [Hoeflea sp. YIM 152468]MDF1607368.1 1-phosphofructokinase family hexose kinase [Hoeflea sp. YIM 152468]